MDSIPSSRAPRRLGRRELARLGWLALLFALLWPASARAGNPVIGPGREQEILALFAPHQLGAELSPGWTLHSVRAEKASILVWIAGPEDAYATVVLDPPGYGPAAARHLGGFDLSIESAPAAAAPAIEALAERVAANDHGEFWAIPRMADELVGDPHHTQPKTWLSDGLLLFGFFLGVLVILLVGTTRGGPMRWAWALVGVFVVSLALRLWLPVEVAMAPWAYTRMLVTAELVYRGPVLAHLHPDPVFLTDVIHDSTRVFAVLAPLAVYVHARYLFADRRAAIVAAALMAVLPLHLRFSASDAAFIPSIAVSSVAFALTHAATREVRRGWALAALLALPAFVALTFLVRPLNILYFPLLVATAFVDEGLHVDKPAVDRRRIIVVAAVLTAVTVGVGVPHLLDQFGREVREGLSLRTLASALKVAFSVRFNALANPAFSPTGMGLLAIYGSVSLWRRGRRRLALFLVLWLVSFFVSHAYVVPRSPLMQARYHLHLVVPFVLLAAAGITASMERLDHSARAARWRLPAKIALFGYLAASPWIHLGFIRDTDFNEMHEWTFVHSLRDQIPRGCTVLEHTGGGMAPRLARVGAYVERGAPRNLFEHVDLASDDRGHEIAPETVSLLRAPPECLFFLQGLSCVAAKDNEAPIAPACDDVIGWFPNERVASTSFESHVYDGNLGERLGAVEHIELVLYSFDTSGRR